MPARTLLLVVLTAALATAPGVAAEKAAPCSSAEHHQLDFWRGDWDSHDLAAGGKVDARCRVEAILGGCVLHERYEQTDGLVGESFSLYDAARGVWHQSWVTNHGQLLEVEGKLEGGKMVLEGDMHGAGGKTTRIHAVWYPQDGGVRETATTSSDGGKTWQPLFDILFQPHKP
jgi:hypothetical protein